jgi:hypothetical protein
MERAPFAHVALALVVFAAVMATYFWAFRRLQKRSTELTRGDHFLGYFIFGPLHSGLAERGYKLTLREKVGLGFVFSVVITIIVGSVVTAYAGT